MNKTGLLIAVVAVLGVAGPAGPAGAEVPRSIDFTIAPARAKSGEAVQLELRYRAAGSGSSEISRPVPLSALQGLSSAELASETGRPAQFRIVREAGTLDCSGIVRRGRGTGECRFAPNPRYAAELERRGIGRPSAEQQFQLALHGASLAVTDELIRQGYRPGIDDLVEAGIFGVTQPYLRELAALGYRAGSVDRLVEMRIHDVSPSYIRQIAAIGPAYRGLAPEQLVEMRIHRVTPELVRALAQAGYRDLDRQELVSMAIHGVTPEYIRETAAAGYRDLTPEQLIELRIHGVDSETARRVNAAVGRQQ